MKTSILFALLLNIQMMYIKAAQANQDKQNNYAEKIWVSIIFPEQYLSSGCYSCYDVTVCAVLNFELPLKCNISYLHQLAFDQLKNKYALKINKYEIKFKRSGNDYFDPNDEIEFSEDQNVLYAYVHLIKNK
jgi:hypothetical protein